MDHPLPGSRAWLILENKTDLDTMHHLQARHAYTILDTVWTRGRSLASKTRGLWRAGEVLNLSPS